MREPHNKARGEVLLAIDERDVRLCVTLGALAELESAFDVASLAALGERLSQLNAGDLLIVIACLSAGGGQPLNVAQVANARIDAKAAAQAVAEAFRVAFDG